MSEMRDLYQETILDHYKNPRNKEKPEAFNRFANGNNPLCGDKIQVYATIEGGLVKEIHFQGSGCAISTASASLMTESLIGKTEAEALALFERFHDFVTHDAAGLDDPAKLGKLQVFSGVREFPARVKCASLAWHTLRAALDQKGETVTTE